MGWRRKKSWYRKENCRLGNQRHKIKSLPDEGRNFENRVEQVMLQMCLRGELSSVTHHAPNSFEDQHGKDFTVTKMVGEVPVTKSFGVTFSMSRELRATRKHPDVPQRYIPHWSSDENIKEVVLNLFRGVPAAASPT